MCTLWIVLFIHTIHRTSNSNKSILLFRYPMKKINKQICRFRNETNILVHSVLWWNGTIPVDHGSWIPRFLGFVHNPRTYHVFDTSTNRVNECRFQCNQRHIMKKNVILSRKANIRIEPVHKCNEFHALHTNVKQVNFIFYIGKWIRTIMEEKTKTFS